MVQEKEDSGTSASSSRRLSLPDLAKLKEEWDRREAIQATAQLSPGKLQVNIFFSIRLFDRRVYSLFVLIRLIYLMFEAMLQ